ncbi:MAG TPA: type I 3-dehydroquinate dehydratase [Kiritimatiellia bacterium]|jgi:3-dehydroquinate dehydratase-1|nr:type I 3-dehydroquinate dehydratase [Lentisphaerota bacterium]HRV31252.1 type I 3-dehydroquinate dehydratase [Kiritimatiellia bacterium]
MKTRFGICPMIVGCVATADPLRRYARRPPASCDMLEVRLDLIGADNGSWKERCAAIRDKGMPVLLTVRSAQEGGEWRGREAERLALYLAGMPYVSAIDLEINTRAFEKVAQTARRFGVRVVGSFHDFRGTPDVARLVAIEARGRRLGADVVKIATMVQSSGDLARVLALPAQFKKPVSILGMGPLGAVSRVALPCAGSCLVYGSLGAATAPGQLSCRTLARELKRWGVRN